jgi:hypothetical protein
LERSSNLKALYRINPIRPEDALFSVADDYPRSEVNDYEDGVHNGEPHAAKCEPGILGFPDAQLRIRNSMRSLSSGRAWRGPGGTPE